MQFSTDCMSTDRKPEVISSSLFFGRQVWPLPSLCRSTYTIPARSRTSLSGIRFSLFAIISALSNETPRPPEQSMYGFFFICSTLPVPSALNILTAEVFEIPYSPR